MHPTSPASLLAEIDAAEQHSLSISRAERAGRFLVLWGLVWMVGYLASWRLPAWGTVVWPVVIMAGITGSMMLSRQMARTPQGRTIGRQMGLASGAFYLFTFAACAVLQPDPMQTMAFFPLVVGLGYVLLGVFWSNRITAAGFLVMAMTLAGWFLLRDNFLPWMAGCGAMLVAGGLAMRRA